MRALRRFLVRLFTTAAQRRDEDRLREEIEDHLAASAADRVRAGLTPDEARRHARLEFGSIEAFKDDYRDRQGLPFIEHLVQDVRLAVRRMAHAPGFTTAAVLTLALGFGLNSAVLSLAYSIYLRPLPVDDASRVVFIDYRLSMGDYASFRASARDVIDIAAHYSTSPMQLATDESAFPITGSVATANYFSLLRLQPALGRFFSEEEDRVRGAHPVVVLSYRLWASRFDKDTAILGRPVRLNGVTFTVIGVAPDGFLGLVRGVDDNDVWIPSAMFSVGYRYCDAFAPDCHIVDLVGRLATGVSIDAAQSKLDALTRQLEAGRPDTGRRHELRVRPARGIRAEEQMRNARLVALLAAASALVLLIASANVAGLLLARGLRRRREIAIRIALGASRSRLVRLLLVESAVLAVTGCAAGLGIAVWSTRVFFVTNPLRGTAGADLSLDAGVILVSVGIALATGILTGVAPALQCTRTDAVSALKDGTPGAGGRRSRLRESLLVGQVALSVVLVACSGLLIRSFLTLHRGPGFALDEVLMVRLRPSLIGYSHDRSWEFQREVVRRLEQLPGVLAASTTNSPFLPGWLRGGASVRAAEAKASEAIDASMTTIGDRFFAMLGVSIAEGREFDTRDGQDSARVAIVSRRLADRLWPQAPAIGQTIVVDNARCQVVGVVADLDVTSVSERAFPTVYLNYWQQDRASNWASDSRTHVRVAGDAAAFIPEIRRVVASVDPDVPQSVASTLASQLDTQFVDVRVARTLLLTFGALAAVLSAIGLHAALAFDVVQRRREIAIRLALGAERREVRAIVVRRGVAIIGTGLAVGLGGAVLAGPLFASMLYGVSPHDWLTLLGGPVLISAIVVAAIWLPARRAMSVDPIAALRAE